MSAWRVVVQELYRCGPMCAARFSLPGAVAGLRDAVRLGMVVGPGKAQKGGLYRLTDAGIAAAQNRLAYVTAAYTAKGPTGRNRLVPTWLASLPPANAIRLGAP